MAVKIAGRFKICIVFPNHLFPPGVIVKAFFFVLFQIFHGALLNAAVVVPRAETGFPPCPRRNDFIVPAGKGGISAQTLKAVPFDLVHAVAGYADILPDILQTLAVVVVAAYYAGFPVCQLAWPPNSKAKP